MVTLIFNLRNKTLNFIILCLKSFEILLSVLSLVVDLLIEILFSLQRRLSDQGQFIGVFALLSVQSMVEGLAHIFNNLHDTLLLSLLDSSDQEDDRELISENLLTKDFNELLVENSSLTVNVVHLFVLYLGIALGHNSDEEVHKANKENDDVDHIEDDPNKEDHYCSKALIFLTIAHSCFPICVLRN